MPRPKLSLILPAYNEAAVITDVVSSFSRFLAASNVAYEILVVDDGSRDETAERATAVSQKNPFVRLVRHTVNRGYGAALKSGFAAARGDYIFFTDSDGQFLPDDLVQFLPLLEAKTILLGYRAQRQDTAVRRLNAWLWGQCIRLFLRVKVRDLDCAWKLFPRSMLEGVRLVSDGAFISAELLYYARRKKLLFHEMSVRHFARRAGSSTGANWRVIMRAFRELLHFLTHRDST